MLYEVPKCGCSLDKLRSVVIFLMWLYRKFSPFPDTAWSVSLKNKFYCAVAVSSTIYCSVVWEGNGAI